MVKDKDKEPEKKIIKKKLEEDNKEEQHHHTNAITRQVQIQKPDIQVSISSEDPDEHIEMLLDMSLFVIEEFGSKKHDG